MTTKRVPKNCKKCEGSGTLTADNEDGDPILAWCTRCNGTGNAGWTNNVVVMPRLKLKRGLK